MINKQRLSCFDLSLENLVTYANVKYVSDSRSYLVLLHCYLLLLLLIET